MDWIFFHRWIRDPLRVKQKAEGGKKTFTFHFHEKEERAEEKEVELGHDFIEEKVHRNRGVLPSFIAGTAGQKSRSTVCI